MINDTGAAPIKVGILNDLAEAPSTDLASGGGVEHYVRVAIDEVRAGGRLDRDVELITAYGLGLPRGTAAAVERAYAELAAQDVLVIVGPAIGDNALVATPLADAACLPTIHWAGTGKAGSQWMFHLQVGSHEDEATVLVRQIVATGARERRPRVRPLPHRQALRRLPRVRVRGTRARDHRTPHRVTRRRRQSAREVGAVMATAPDALVYLGLGLSGRAVAAAKRAAGWDVPAYMNSAGMFGHVPEVGADLDGWTYVDMYSDTNTTLAALRERLGPDHAPEHAGASLAYGYDLGQLVTKASPSRARAHPGRGARRARTDQVGPRGRGSRGHDAVVRHLRTAAPSTAGTSCSAAGTGADRSRSPDPVQPVLASPRAPPERHLLTPEREMCVVPEGIACNWFIRSNQILLVATRPARTGRNPGGSRGPDGHGPDRPERPRARFVSAVSTTRCSPPPRRRSGVLAGGRVRWLLERRQAPGPDRRQPRHRAVLVGDRRHADPSHPGRPRELLVTTPARSCWRWTRQSTRATGS